MAVAATNITDFHKWPMGDGLWGIRFKYTGPSSYTASGEVLSKTVCKAAMEGISEIYSLMVPRAMPVGGATSVACGFEVLNTSTNTGTFHYYNSVDTHTHDIKAIGGLTSSEALFLDASQSFGKTAATNRTIVGSTSATTGGVVATADDIADNEAAASGNYSTYIAYCYGIGRM
jgi:hypothetical protein